MKISASKVFDAQKVISSFTAAKVTGIDDFVNGLCDLSQQVVSILSRRVSIRDNIDCIEKVFTVRTTSEIVRYLPPDQNRPVRHIVHTRTSDFNNPLLSFTWRYTAGGEIELKLNCQSSGPNDLTFIMYY